MSSISINKGLEGIYLDETKLSSVNGLEGILTIRGYGLEEFAGKASNEEVIYLVLYGEFPDKENLEKFERQLRDNRLLPDITIELLKQAVTKNLVPMDALRIGVSSLALYMADDQDTQAIQLIASAPVILATYLRLQKGKERIPPNSDLNQVPNFFYMIEGEEAASNRIRALETYFNTVIEHGLNASTFVARSILSTDSDINSAITGAIGALKGPAHGGAPGPALDMVLEMQNVEDKEAYLREKLDRGERIMGFGHRVYKVRDPRAKVLGDAAEKLFIGDQRAFYEFVLDAETLIKKLLDEYKPGRNLYTNVEFYTALLLYGIGFETETFSSLFGISRMTGWIAHCLEQKANNRLIRPRILYTGEFGKKFNRE